MKHFKCKDCGEGISRYIAKEHDGRCKDCDQRLADDWGGKHPKEIRQEGSL